MTGPPPLTPREQLVVAAWERRRMLAALLTGSVEGHVPPLMRPLCGGLAATAALVAVLLLR